ncbi:MAG: hypothetical protein QNL12_07605 [Acidimicrobiia bacterium]|nr:hypothetical protein [Acidimicrobiia bacterium]MDX2467162.1 hypothetical protein [Acidimicrobiia bacterium]
MRLLLPLILLVAACGTPDAGEAAALSTAEPVAVSMSLYVVDGSDGGPGSSQRTVAEVEDIAVRMNTIWAQAGIELTIRTVARINVPNAVLSDLALGDTSSFLQTAGSLTIPDPATINGFYVNQIGTANGVAPFSARIFFVADNPTVNDERVSSHEVGHILGLHHDLEDDGRLMFSGTNGTQLADEQITAARYAAQGILDGVR